MAEQPKIAAPQITAPKGGGAISSIGEAVQPNAFTGSAQFSIPISATPCRNFEPALSVDYNSGGGNGPFGIGFELSLSTIARKTSTGIPHYDDDDRFIFAGGEELVPELVEQPDGSWNSSRRQITQDGVTWNVISYRPRLEGTFAAIEQWIDATTRLSYWKVLDSQNMTSIYGRSADARIADPSEPTHIFQWLLEEVSNLYGNRREYVYKQENRDQVPDQIYEQNRQYSANRYLHAIRYGNDVAEVPPEPAQAQSFEVVFDYGEYDLNNPDAPPGTWTARADPFSTYNAGFEIRTYRLCRAVLLYHQFGTERFAVSALRFDYHEMPALTFLQAVQRIGYRQQTVGVYTTAVMPPVELTYTAFDPTTQSFAPLYVLDGTPLPGVAATPYLLADLWGEGLPGLLRDDRTTTLYFAPGGGGAYDFPEPLAQFPIEGNLENSSSALIDLDGNGRLDLCISSPTRSGYYQSNPDGSWEAYTSFETYPNEIADPRRELVDLEGSGLIDLLFFTDNDLRIYPSLGTRGFGDPLLALRVPQFPTTAGPAEYVGFADIFGDGLQHRVRVRSGSVECWPNLGYGRFGAPVLLGNAPEFGGALDPSRLRLADIDGSGTTDLAYIYPDRVEIFLNQSGNAYRTQPIIVTLPQPYEPLDQISFADVLGSGTTSLIFTKTAPTTASYYYDFTGGTKPYLLTTTDNQLGMITRISYRSSTAYYLADKAAGLPWVTTLPFPMQVVSRIESIDPLSQTKLVTSYTYHHGYYDPIEREFRGFGFVEELDSESFEPGLQQSQGDRSLQLLNEARFVPPSLNKTWYHTGAYIEAAALADQYAREYFHGDTAAYDMPASYLEPAIDLDDAATVRQAYRALAGKVLHQELYGLDDQPGRSENPYSVVESNFTVRLEQPRDGRRPASFYVYPREMITYAYERDPADPRVEHAFTLDVDPFGNVTCACDLFYPRRTAKPRSPDPADQHYPEQQQLLATFSRSCPINLTDGCRWLGLPGVEKGFELSGLDRAGQPYFSFDRIKGQIEVALAHALRYDEPFTAGETQARLFSWVQTRYWNADQTATLPVGQASPLALRHYVEDAVMPTELVARAFDTRLTPAMLTDEGGYVLHDDYWWNQGLEQIYYTSAAQFYLPYQTQSALGDLSIVAYDPYWLIPTTITAYVSETVTNVTSALIDYYTLQPRQITDINNTISQALVDPLGMVIASTLYKVEADGTIIGDRDLSSYTVRTGATFDDVLARPEYYLQQAGSFFFYDVLAWTERRQPASFISLVRETFVSDLPPDTESPIQIVISYSDGFGRTLETKRRAGPCADALLRTPVGALRYDAAGAILRGAAEDCWIVSGRTVYINQGEPVEQYQPYFSTSPGYEDQAEVTDNDGVPPPSRFFYDALIRVARTQTPKGFLTSVGYTSWVERQFDEDDTVLESPYYKEHYHDAPPDEKNALDKAAVFADTPLAQVLDPMGRGFLAIAINVEQLSAVDPPTPRSYLLTRSTLDILGNTLAIADPRLGPQGLSNDTGIFDMSGNALATTSVDAGQRWQLGNIAGNPIHDWDGRGFHRSISYDRLQRPISTRVVGDDQHGLVLDQIVERIEYGETQSNSQELNLRGQVFRHYDQAGIVTVKRYSLLGGPEHTERQLLQDYKHEVNWDDPAKVPLDCGEYPTKQTFNALNLITTQTTADGSRFVLSYDLLGLLARIDLIFADQTEQTVVKAIDYNANQQRTRIHYGNDTIATFAYEPTTLRLQEILTTRPADPSDPTRPTQLQQIVYTYDPVGNVTRTRDYSPATLFCDQQDVDPLFGYTYDAIYRLIQTCGRQHPGILCDTHRDGFKQSLYLPLCQSPHPNDLQKLQRYLERYTYDDSSNLTSLQHTASNGGPAWTQRIAIPTGSNRGVPEACASLNGGTRSLFPPTTYDGDGNMQNLENLRALGWNYRDNIARADIILREDGSSDSDYYVYDSAGQRVRKVSERYINGGTLTEIRETIYLGDLLIYRIKQQPAAGTPTTIVERYSLHVLAGEDRLAIIDIWTADRYGRETASPGARKYRYQLNTLIGSSAVELDAQANVISYEEYFPYGGTSLIAGYDQSEVARKDYRYAGKECDDTTGLYYYGLRYYAAWLGRWLSPDPTGADDGLNLYAFVGGNPISYTDPSGGCKSPDPRTKPIPIFTLNPNKSEALQLYRYLDQPDVDYYTELAEREHQAIHINSDLVNPLSNARFPSDIESEIWDTLERHRGLHLASNPALETGWTDLTSKYTGSKTGASLYTATRSPGFSNVLNSSPVLDFKDSQWVRPPEVHHLIYKSIRPQYAVQPWNLMLATRGNSSVTGQHEGVFHLIGAAKTGNLYQNLAPAVERLVLSWAGQEPSFYSAPSLRPTSFFSDPIVQDWSSKFEYSFSIKSGLISSGLSSPKGIVKTSAKPKVSAKPKITIKHKSPSGGKKTYKGKKKKIKN